jgi:hypothetical protein
MIDHYRFVGSPPDRHLFRSDHLLFRLHRRQNTLSFAFALLCIWKILIPGMLDGANPILLALLVGNAISSQH